MEKLIKALSENLYERENIVAQTLLAILAGQSVFLYGPPGTGKSLIARRVVNAFDGAKFFEYLMNRFSTPDEVFGPVSIKELKDGRYVRKTEGFLPTADIAFLDEIWKSSPAILNTLLTIINERKFSNGNLVEKVPLKGIVSASNEIPEENQGLAALYDRFILRLPVFPVKERKSFEAMLKTGQTPAEVKLEQEWLLTDEKWEELLEMAKMVEISEDVLNIVHAIRQRIDEENHGKDSKGQIYISDRRWQKMLQILKMAAYLCDRDSVLPVDVLILKNCLWEKFESREKLTEIVEKSVREFCPYHSEKYEKWEEDLDDTKKEIEETFFYDSDQYEGTETIGGEECFDVPFQEFPIQDKKHTYYCNPQYQLGTKRLYFPLKFFKIDQEFHPLDEKGEEIEIASCNFNNTCLAKISVEISSNYRVATMYGYQKNWTFTPKLKYRTGDCKPVTTRIKKMYQENLKALLNKHFQIEKEISDYYAKQQAVNATPFVEDKEALIVLESISEFRQKVNTGKLDAEQLLDKLNNHVDG